MSLDRELFLNLCRNSSGEDADEANHLIRIMSSTQANLVVVLNAFICAVKDIDWADTSDLVETLDLAMHELIELRTMSDEEKAEAARAAVKGDRWEDAE